MPKINQIIYISIDDSNFSYKSRVADISQMTFSIEMPIDVKTGMFKAIEVESYINIWFSTEHGQYSFETKVIQKKIENVPLLVLEKPENIDRLQRRNFLRVSATVEMSYKMKDTHDNSWNLVRTIDISGGGLQFILPFPKNISENQEIEGWLVLPFHNNKIEHIKFIGVVVRVIQPNENVNVHWVSTKFKQLKENEREKIIRFCYEKQVEYRKKGAL